MRAADNRPPYMRILPFLLPIVITVVLFVIDMTDRKFPAFPSERSDVIAFSDKEQGGKGESEVISCGIVGSHIELRYRLRDGFIRPYAGLRIDLNGADLTGYSRIKIDVDPGAAESLRVSLLSAVSGYSSIDNIDSFLFMQAEVSFDSKRTSLIIPLRNMFIPYWWNEENFSRYDDRGKKDLKNIRYIDIRSGTSHQLNSVNKITLYDINMLKNPLSILYRYSFMLLLYIPWVLFIVFNHLTHAVKSKTVLRSSLENSVLCSEIADTETVKLVAYIGEYYSDPMLTVKKVASETEVGQHRISELLQKSFGLSFPQYVNNIRLIEAKRLLSDTDRKVSEIAVKVGFSSINHFNRLFQKIENCSPQKYRKNK